jgi:hypothetical protein
MKVLTEGKSVRDLEHLYKLKARIDLVGSAEDVETIIALLKDLSKKAAT